MYLYIYIYEAHRKHPVLPRGGHPDLGALNNSYCRSTIATTATTTTTTNNDDDDKDAKNDKTMIILILLINILLIVITLLNIITELRFIEIRLSIIR